ncbi:hypothetical protein [Mesobacillus zeae]|uniref:Uncharacterized protein n=1 Tax=Mesobacillus zeae TaxID=1917180 RepID=A0A398BDX1_9BACI|nr:hypothetical protein [Mesobacillus zeae]RID87824.1 hypothetical protein D1970_03000 [Mesobacillus zeae]
MHDSKRMEIGWIPIKTGKIKIRVYGFAAAGTEGTVTAELNGVTTAARGYIRKRTIIRAISKLHYSLQKKE